MYPISSRETIKFERFGYQIDQIQKSKYEYKIIIYRINDNEVDYNHPYTIHTNDCYMFYDLIKIFTWIVLSKV